MTIPVLKKNIINISLEKKKLNQLKNCKEIPIFKGKHLKLDKKFKEEEI